MKQNNHSLQIFYEIALSIGNSLDLHKMLRESLLAYLNKLNCTGCIVISDKELQKQSGYKHEFCLPYSLPGQINFSQLLDEAKKAHQLGIFSQSNALKNFITHQTAQGIDYIMPLTGYGCLVLSTQGQQWEADQLISIGELNRKLAQACKSCLQNTELEIIRYDLQVLADNIPNHIWYLKDPETYGAVNFAHASFVGRTKEEMAEKSLLKFFPGRAGNICTSGNKWVFENKKTLTSEEIFVNHKGEERLFSIIKSPKLDKEGNVQYVVCSGEDITEARKAEQMLQQRNAQLAGILQSQRDLIARMSHKGVLTYANEAFCETLGVNYQTILGINALEIFPAHLTNQLTNIFNSLFSAPHKTIAELELPTLSGHRWFSWECYAIMDSQGNIFEIQAVGRDIHKQKQTEKALEEAIKQTETASLRKSRLVATVSHEVRTPLNGIMGFSELLSKTSLTEEQQKYLELIRKNSSDILYQINELLDLSKVEAGKVTFKKRPLRTISIVNAIEDLYKPLALNKGLGFNLTVEKDFPEFFKTDEKRFMQIIHNLLSNALKFTSEGKIEVIFKVRKITRLNYSLEIKVKDTGQGIPESHQRFLFQEFVQFSDNENLRLNSSGLGLHISKKLARLLEGDICFASEEKKGSDFTFSFKSPRNSESLNEDTCSQGSYEFKNLDIDVLVVEDQKTNQMVALLILKEMGCRVKLAENGRMAIDMIQNNSFDVVLMDIHMPVMDGVKAVKELRNMNIPLPSIIGLSAEAMEGDAKKYISLGMDDYLTKPIDSALLYSKLSLLKRNN
jgi:PAS domain S-box-containing protein